MKNKKFVVYILCALVFLNILAWNVVLNNGSSRLLELVFFDIGQGDAIFIETPRKYQILIDGGPDSLIIEKLAREMDFGDNAIDLIILTHPDSDHITGLIDVLERYKVDNIIYTGVAKNTIKYKKFKDLIEKQDAKIIIAKHGQRIKLGQVVLDILYPFENLYNKEISNVNNTSVVARMSFKENSFLFTGDIVEKGEKEILEKQILLDSDVLKTAHHGSKTSSSREFIEAVSPEIAVIQCERNNRFGHPHLETMEIFKEFGVKVFRTDIDGDIRIIADGAKIKYE
ncbi:MAG: ComEC/Rec2 family competence protein [Patescibacteria group bacterium]|nr:ComEC/Rec2 family competence protein [Patescibacteria group bacterium]